MRVVVCPEEMRFIRMHESGEKGPGLDISIKACGGSRFYGSAFRRSLKIAFDEILDLLTEEEPASDGGDDLGD
jgi:hypothetical protein